MKRTSIGAVLITVLLSSGAPGATRAQAQGGAATGAGQTQPAAATQPAGKPEDTSMQATEGRNPALLDPSLANEQAPATFLARFHTTKGDFKIRVTREWSPQGADRFYNLVQIGYFKDIAVFRVVKGFMAQFGIHGDPAVSAKWRDARLRDDPVKQSNKRGFVTYAMGGANTRTTQFFINYADTNARLDGQGFSPFGLVVEGMEVVDSFYSGYGDGPPQGRGPNQGQVQTQGNAYLKAQFPEMDYILDAKIVPE